MASYLTDDELLRGMNCLDTVICVPDPTHLDPRAVSPAEALHGSYDDRTAYASGSKTDVNYGVRTDCLRAGIDA